MRFRTNPLKKTNLLLSTSIILALSATWAGAQTAASPEKAEAPIATTPSSPEKAAAPKEDQGILVLTTGFKKGYADAVKMKKKDTEIIDAISSGGQGRFPDLNLGEAIQRIPGIQLNREEDGRNATVNLRGLTGEYIRYTMNGVAFAEPYLADATPLGAFNSEIFSAVRAEKTQSASSQSGGLTGNLDLIIDGALSRKDGGFFKTSYEYNELGGLGSPGASIAYNKHFGSDFAVFGVLSYKKEAFRRDSIFDNNYGYLNQSNTPNFASLYSAYYGAKVNGVCPAGEVCSPTGTGALSTRGIQIVTQPRQVVRDNEGDVTSGAWGAEWKHDNLKLGVTGFMTDREDTGTVQNLLIVDTSGANTIVTPTSDPKKMSSGQYIISNYNFSNPDVTASTRKFPQITKSWTIDANGEFKKDNWVFTSVLTASEGQASSVETQFDFDTLSLGGAGNGVTGSFASGAGTTKNFLLALSPNPAVTANGSGWAWGGVGNPTAYYNSTATNHIQFTGTQSYTTNRLGAAQFDAERFIDKGIITSVKFGYRYEDNEYASIGARTSGYGLQIQNLNPGFVGTSAYAGSFFNGAVSSTSNWQATNLADIALLSPVSVYPGGGLSRLGYNIRYSDNNYALYNFTNETALNEAYVKLNFETVLWNIPINGNLGDRFEAAANTITTLDRLTPNGAAYIGPNLFSNNVYKQNYDKSLPSLMVKADLTGQVYLRFAAYDSYSRPSTREFPPASIVSNASSGGVYSVTYGNPYLKPVDATNYDVALEWYNRPNSLVSATYFVKDVKGLVTTTSNPNILCPADATGLGLGHLHVANGVCLSDLLAANGQPVQVNFTGYENASQPIQVSGIELAVQQNLDFLPAPWDKFGGTANYSLTNVSGSINGATAVLNGISKNNLNLIGFYENNGVSVRVIYNYRDAYSLPGGTTFSGAARSVAARGQLDMSASYNVNKQITVSLDAFNLTNALRLEYQDDLSEPRRADYDGRTYQMTVRVKL